MHGKFNSQARGDVSEWTSSRGRSSIPLPHEIFMRRCSRTVLLALCAIAPSLAAQTPGTRELERANIAWDRGDYPAALEGYARLLQSPNAEQVRRSIALTTGELYRTVEVAPDGRNIRFSPSGRYAAFETGSGSSRTTTIVAVERSPRVIGSVPGSGLVFSPSGEEVAYLRIAESEELTRAREELSRLIAAAQDRQAALAQIQTIARLEAKQSRIVVRDLRTRSDREIDAGGLLVGQLAYSADGRTLYFVGAREGDSSTDIYAIGTGGSRPSAVTSGPGVKSDILVPVGGGVLVYTLGGRSALVRAAGGAGGGRGAGAGGATGAQGQAVPRVAILDLATGATRQFDGSSVALSADGSTLAYLAREGSENLINVLALRGAAGPVTVKRTTDRLDAPTLSPDGRTVAYTVMLDTDWEIFTVRSDGSADTRITREIQHDLYPRFLTNDRILAVMGEARHRRSYLYDAATGARTRLFHNNTVRTVAPEYEWSASSDGSKVLIVSERDGDTISPERGVYLVELSAELTAADVLDRVRRNLAVERDLRARGEKMFAPIAGGVRSAVADVSMTRVYGYEKALSEFDSRHITRPGNRAAAEYLFNTFTAMGYEPEYQWFEPRGLSRTANVVATLKGTTHPDVVYVVGGHYDSVPVGPGADDDASGIAVLLESARVLKDHPLPATVVFVAFTGEESGLLGSREFVRRAVEARLGVAGALNNDMMGWSNDHRLDNTIRFSNAGIRDVQHASAFLFSNLITYDAKYYKSTDAHSFYDAYGDVVAGIGSYPILGNPHYHQSHDVLETINHEQITETAKTTVASLMLLASSPARLSGLTVARYDGKGAAELRWTPSREKDVTAYEVAYGPASDPTRSKVTVRTPRAALTGVAPGSVVAVRALNARGLYGWDWARVVVGAGEGSSTTAAQ